MNMNKAFKDAMSMMMAGPEMYEALKNLIAVARPQFSDSVQLLALRLAEEAIAKAEGRT